VDAAAPATGAGIQADAKARTPSEREILTDSTNPIPTTGGLTPGEEPQCIAVTSPKMATP
jgi:hypothetical protein